MRSDIEVLGGMIYRTINWFTLLTTSCVVQVNRQARYNTSSLMIKAMSSTTTCTSNKRTYETIPDSFYMIKYQNRSVISPCHNLPFRFNMAAAPCTPALS